VRPRYNYEYNIKIDLNEIGSEGVDLVYLIQDRDKLQVFSRFLKKVVI
jgi:hypothetical protein